MKRSILALVVVVLAGLLAVTPALAQDDDGHCYGLVFFEHQLNGFGPRRARRSRRYVN